MTFAPGLTPPDKKDKTTWLLFAEGMMLAATPKGRVVFPEIESPSELGLVPIHELYLGILDGRPVYAAETLLPKKAPKGWRFHPMRGLFDKLAPEQVALASRAVQLVTWERANRFCGRCGTAMHAKTDEIARECPACGHLVYPRISPAMIVAVTRGDRILLAKAAKFKREMYSVLAGFVEPGESLEECVRREVREEVGIEIGNIRYVGSQSWPFPHSLMVGFTAEHASGEIRVDGDEIVDARWFTADELPPIPGKISIARQLIDAFVENQRGE